VSGELIATALGLCIAAGVSPYATVAVLGLAERAGWIGTLPSSLEAVSHTWVITLALFITLLEFIATLVPGIASAWEAVHAAIRPPAAALLAVLMMWGGDPALVAAVALLGGSLAFGTTLTKLGARLAIDTSPEPVSNGAANIAELTIVSAIAVFAWRHPILALVIALLLVITTALLVRAVWGLIWRAVRHSRRPGVGGIRS
jgi:hypothetical protein